MTDRTIIGQRIAELRKEKGLTQAELADMLGVTHQAVSQWERSETLPDILTLPQIADIFGESVNAILGLEELNANGAADEEEIGLAADAGCGEIPDEEKEKLEKSIGEKLAAMDEELQKLDEELNELEEEDGEQDEEAEADEEPAEDEEDSDFYSIRIPPINIPGIPEIRLPVINIPKKEVILSKINVPSGEELRAQVQDSAEQWKEESKRIKQQIKDSVKKSSEQFERAFEGTAEQDNGGCQRSSDDFAQFSPEDFSLPASDYVYDFAGSDEDYEIALVKNGEIVHSFVGNPGKYLRIELNNLGGSLKSAFSVTVNGDVGGSVNAGLGLKVGGSVNGGANAGLGIDAGGDINGSATAGLGITCRRVNGTANKEIRYEGDEAPDDDCLDVDGKNITIEGDYDGDLSGAANITVQGDVNGEIAAGGSVVVEGDVNGDVDAGSEIAVAGNVAGDVDAGSGAEIGGSVSGDVDAGGNVTVGQAVGGSVDAGGNVQTGGEVGGDVDAGSKVTVAGDVNGSVDAGGNVQIEGDVNGDVEGNKVVINGNLNR